MFLIRPLLALTALAALSLGCDHVDVTDELPPSSTPLTVEERGLVDFLADHELSTEEVLDVECGLRSNAAHSIDRYRRGPDERYGTDDDREIDSEQTLDAIHQVGPATIDQLYDCAEELGYIDDDLEDDDLEDDTRCDDDCDR